jgi:hypothetical protein
VFSEDLEETRENEGYDQNGKNFWDDVPHELKGIVTPVIQNLEPCMLFGLGNNGGNGHWRDYK